MVRVGKLPMPKRKSLLGFFQKPNTISEAPEVSVARVTASVECLEQLGAPDPELVVKEGDLYKWANYIKGYRRRRFALDAQGFLSYYKYKDDQLEKSCHGKIDLREARVTIDGSSGGFVVASAGQMFHLKAPSPSLRDEWVAALNLARHRTTRGPNEEVGRASNSTSGESYYDADGAEASRQPHGLAQALHRLAGSRQQLETRLDALKKLQPGPGLAQAVAELRTASEMVLKNAAEVGTTAGWEVDHLRSLVQGERRQRDRLDEQILALAQQQNTLELIAKRSNNPNVTDLEEFYDAEEEFIKSTPRRRDEDLVMAGGSPEASTSQMARLKTSFEASPKFPATTARPTLPRRRDQIPERPKASLSLWSILKNSIGKDLSRIPMPVNFSEPLSMLQRVTEDLEYAHLLDTAASAMNPSLQMCHVAAFAVSSYATTGSRTTKPFNPMLGETYECDRVAEYGWRSLTEQVSHHPPGAAHYVEGRGWKLYQLFTMTSLFRGKYLSLVPVGRTHIIFDATGHHYTLTKVTTTVHNIIVGKLWIDNHGEMEIVNHTTGHRCSLKFHPYSYFTREPQRQVHGEVVDKDRVAQHLLSGHWNSEMRMAPPGGTPDSATTLWTADPPMPNADKTYGFTKFAVQLNEPEPGVAPTDSRLRPDQRLMEAGQWDAANAKKVEIEEKQRVRRRQAEVEAARVAKEGKEVPEVNPLWFDKLLDPDTKLPVYISNGDYWKCKDRQDWSRCPDLF